MGRKADLDKISPQMYAMLAIASNYDAAACAEGRVILTQKGACKPAFAGTVFACDQKSPVLFIGNYAHYPLFPVFCVEAFFSPAEKNH